MVSITMCPPMEALVDFLSEVKAVPTGDGASPTPTFPRKPYDPGRMGKPQSGSRDCTSGKAWGGRGGAEQSQEGSG